MGTGLARPYAFGLRSRILLIVGTHEVRMGESTKCELSFKVNATKTPHKRHFTSTLPLSLNTKLTENSTFDLLRLGIVSIP